MKKLMLMSLILGFVSVSFATNCQSGDLAKDIDQIQAAELDPETVQDLIESSKIAKLTEIIACSASRYEISTADSEFALQLLQEQESNEIAQMRADLQTYLTLLQTENLSEDDKESYQWLVQDIPKRIQESIIQTKEIISGIKRNTRH